MEKFETQKLRSAAERGETYACPECRGNREILSPAGDMVPCPGCKGHGLSTENQEACGTCRGWGEIFMPSGDKQTCNTCKGTGRK